MLNDENQENNCLQNPSVLATQNGSETLKAVATAVDTTTANEPTAQQLKEAVSFN
jgi:hypothetical protein